MDAETRSWHESQVKGFVAVQGTYATLATTVRRILEVARDRYAPIARVQAREKQLGSFAEKIVRKYHKYKNPLARMTDLAGARVIVYTLDQVQAMCRFVENESGFRIDWENSNNTATRLSTAEFGYNAVHYVVELVSDEILGVSIPNYVQSIPASSQQGAGRSLKIEIQICTHLQHVWSAIGHDRIYKTEVEVPPALRRDVHRVAALLETADQAFAQAVEALDEFMFDFDALRDPGDLQDEIDTWAAVNKNAPQDPKPRMELARKLMAAERWKDAYDVLSPLTGVERSEDLTLIGRAAWKADRSTVAREQLALALGRDATNVKALCFLGETHLADDDLTTAHQIYRTAFGLQPDEPRALRGLLECQIRKERTTGWIQLMRGTLEAAIQRCDARAERRVYLPEAHLCRGRFYACLGDLSDALDAYARGVLDCETCHPIRVEIDALDRIMEALASGTQTELLLANEQFAAFEIARRFLQVCLLSKSRSVTDYAGDDDLAGIQQRLVEELQPLRSRARSPDGESEPDASEDWHAALSNSIVYVAGCCDPERSDGLGEYRRIWPETFEIYKGVVIGGGTTSGVSGMVGDLGVESSERIMTIGYAPDGLPEGDEIDSRYRIQRVVLGAGYSEMGPIQSWIDLLLAGVEASRVRVFGINGGDLSAFEFRLGAAVGATVGVVADSGRAVKTLLEDESWRWAEKLAALPTDLAAWSAFVNGAHPDLGRLNDNTIESAAQAVHAHFCRLQADDKKKHHESVLPWRRGLPDPYKRSCQHHVRYMSFILRSLGYEVVPIREGDGFDEQKPEPPGFSECIEKLAELEHGRFVAERLAAGWRYGKVNDPDKKTNPTLIGWKELDERNKSYDRDLVSNWPRILAKVGLRIAAVSGSRSEAEEENGP